MLNIVTIRSDRFRSDEALRCEILDLMAPSYEDPTALLTRDLTHCNTLYLARDDDGRLACFFLVAWEPLEVKGQKTLPSLFMGVSAVRQDVKNAGLAGRVYLRCILDALQWEREWCQKLILWSTTATPTVYLAAHTFLAETEPRLDGSYSPSGSEIALAIRRKFWPQLEIGGHPFVLKDVALNTRYSRQELERADCVRQAKSFSLFHELRIDQAEGDRLLFIARTPDKLDFAHFDERPN